MAFILGPFLAGVISSWFGPVLAIGLVGLAYLACTAISLSFVRLRRAAADRAPHERGSVAEEFLAGVRSCSAARSSRWLTILIGALAFVSTGVTDLIIFYLRGVSGQTNGAVGIVFGIASLGAMLVGLAHPRLRRCTHGGLPHRRLRAGGE